MSYTWTITGLQVMNTPEPETVVLSSFMIAKDGQSVSYTVQLLPADPENFTPYNQITQEQAIQWTQEALGPERVEAMQGEVDELIIQAQIPQPQAEPLPWGVGA